MSVQQLILLFVFLALKARKHIQKNEVVSEMKNQRFFVNVILWKDHKTAALSTYNLFTYFKQNLFLFGNYYWRFTTIPQPLVPMMSTKTWLTIPSVHVNHLQINRAAVSLRSENIKQSWTNPRSFGHLQIKRATVCIPKVTEYQTKLDKFMWLQSSSNQESYCMYP